MELLKKHYEKLLLGLVLIGLAIGAALLPIMISAERESLRAKAEEIINKPVKPLPPVDLSGPGEILKRAEARMALDFSSGNKVFNPFPWAKTPDGKIIEITISNVGPRAVVVTNITPLFTIIKLDSVQMGDSGARYMMGVERQAAASASQRRNKGYIATPSVKNDAFMIREVKGPPEAPDALVLELNDTSELATVTKDQPFKREDGYLADLVYPPEKKTWRNLRVGAGGPGTPPIIINGEEYIVVAISKNEVVLSAKSNNKKTPISYNPVPGSR
jgi:hypothetical protein